MDEPLDNPDNILGLYILDAEGNPVECPDVLAWRDWLQQHYLDRRIARDEIDGYRVLTVFLCIDMEHVRALGLRSRMHLFETVVFDPENKRVNRDWASETYETREAALAGHARAVNELLHYLLTKEEL